MRLILNGLAICALTACSPPIPDSGAGVGFDNDAMNPGRAQARQTFTPAVPDSQNVSDETLAVLEQTRPAGTQSPSAQPVRSTSPQREVIEASPSNPAPVQLENAGISDENDFSAVDSRRSIEDDAQRRQEIASQYEVVAPTALPSRRSTGPNIVEYAVNSSNPVGTAVYKRLGFNGQAKFDRNCRAYASADDAQADFLSRGGPERDRLGLDPDGDGYACAWDPTPFRNAVRN